MYIYAHILGDVLRYMDSKINEIIICHKPLLDLSSTFRFSYSLGKYAI